MGDLWHRQVIGGFGQEIGQLQPRGTFPLGGSYEFRPTDALTISGPRELLAARSIPAAYRSDGTVASDTLRAMLESAYTGPVPDGPAPDAVIETRDEDVVWGGNVMSHYGHFLTESVTRLWAVLPGAPLEGRPVVFTTPKQTRFAVDWLEAFGARAAELPKQGAVRFARMHVPEPALRHAAWISPAVREIHLHARRGLEVPPCPRREVVWLSRSKLERDRAPYDESLLEWLLADHVTVYSPEKLALAEQVGMLESSRAAIGVVGSAFHTLLMVRELPECVYLCPPWDQQAFSAQHLLLDTDASFVPALAVAASARRAREGIAFPGAYRLLVPEALRALKATVLPGIADDPRLTAFAALEAGRQPRNRAFASELDAAVAQVLIEPLALEPRRRLGAIFREQGLDRCTNEQHAIVADLTLDPRPQAPS